MSNDSDDLHLSVGDLVRLKSGGPSMTVNGFSSDPEERVICAWFDDSDHYHERTIFSRALRVANED